MTVLLGLVIPLAFAIGWMIADRSRKDQQDVKWDVFHARLNHARDLSMRMGELAQNQNQLSDEQRHLDGLINMKAGSNAMLSEIYVILDEAGNNGTLSLAEDALSATSKSLRILLHVGQHPIQTWNAIEPQLRHVHNTLTQQFLSANDTIHVHNENCQFSDFHINGAILFDRMFTLKKINNLGDSFPFHAESNGITERHQKSYEAWSQPWESRPL